MEEKSYFKQFDIGFQSMKIGQHFQDLKITNEFFEMYENDVVTDANIDIHIDIERLENMVIMHFHFSGTLTSTCDLCLEKVIIPVEKTEKLILKIVEAPQESDDENIFYVTEKEHSFNVEQITYEYIMMSLPMKIEHSNEGEDRCNPKMLELLRQAEKKPETTEIDSRWEALKNLKLDS
ncbi:MAG: DUF177 domain-containing protein [Bacteroidales bacterium]|nr:DUF177 domain-containing protein [Bacteroidales bacterium]MBR4453179.1 DUF177 domain-containing protein [Bacteroidales bacterium]MCR5555431.1 DUF177 domain-containing protein [Bacteroidales bacterium]